MLDRCTGNQCAMVDSGVFMICGVRYLVSPRNRSQAKKMDGMYSILIR